MRVLWTAGSGRMWLWVLMTAALLAGLGLREPIPADEPRFVLAARTMVESGQWLFPQRGSELYAEKPPLFIWMQAASYQLVGDWPVAFLLPSLLAALLVLWLSADLARRLWRRPLAMPVAAALFVCLQFGLQAKRAQIDMVLVALTTLSLWALLRWLLEQRRPGLLVLGTFAAGLGTVTKGVGFLPLLVLPLWWWARPPATQASPARWSRTWLPGAGGFLLGVGVWLLPMLLVVAGSDDPALHAYARDLLLRQTGTRYLDAWHHLKPTWYYLQTIATLWLPGALLLPWLLPAWWRRLRRGDPRQRLLLGWSVLVLLFFSLSPGKREVYIFPVLPALCVAAAPLLPGLLRRRAVCALLWSYQALLVLLAAALGSGVLLATQQRLTPLLEGRGLTLDVARQLGLRLLVFAAVALASVLLLGRLLRWRPALPLVVLTALLWMLYGLGLMPVLSPHSSAHAQMQRVAQHIGPQAELGLLGWREQHLLQADRPARDFGFKASWAQQWQRAQPWLLAAPRQRWLFLRSEAIGPCVDRSQVVPMGNSNRRSWSLLPGSALIPGCVGAPPQPLDADQEPPA